MYLLDGELMHRVNMVTLIHVQTDLVRNNYKVKNMKMQ